MASVASLRNTSFLCRIIRGEIRAQKFIINAITKGNLIYHIRENNDVELSCLQLYVKVVQFSILATTNVERNAFQHTHTHTDTHRQFSCQIIAVGIGT